MIEKLDEILELIFDNTLHNIIEWKKRTEEEKNVIYSTSTENYIFEIVKIENWINYNDRGSNEAEEDDELEDYENDEEEDLCRHYTGEFYYGVRLLNNKDILIFETSSFESFRGQEDEKEKEDAKYYREILIKAFDLVDNSEKYQSKFPKNYFKSFE